MPLLVVNEGSLGERKGWDDPEFRDVCDDWDKAAPPPSSPTHSSRKLSCDEASEDVGRDPSVSSSRVLSLSSAAKESWLWWGGKTPDVGELAPGR